MVGSRAAGGVRGHAIAFLAAAIGMLCPGMAWGGDDLVIEAELDPKEPYVQAEALYTVRLYRRSSFLTGDFVQPEIPNAVIEPIGESEPVDVERNGEPWQLIEHRSLLSFQSSGAMEIPGPVYSGRSAYVKGEAVRVRVRPRPAGWEGWWLPARELRIEQEWCVPDAPVRAGQPVERIVTINADGLTGAQLPELPLAEGDGFEAVRSHVQARHRIEGGHLRGRRVEHQVIIPERAGILRVPALEIEWWDTDTDRKRVATLPGRAFRISAASTNRNTPPSGSAQAGDGAATNQPLPPERSPAWDTIGAIALVVFTIPLVLLVAMLGIRSAGFRTRWRRFRARRGIVSAGRKGDPAAARSALLDWAGACWPAGPPLNLGELARRLDDRDAADAVRALDGALYGGLQRSEWDGRRFIRRVLPALSAAARRPHRNGARRPARLPPLNPGGN